MMPPTWPAIARSSRISWRENRRRRSVWTTSTPIGVPRSAIGTPTKEWYFSSPVSGKYLYRGCAMASTVITGSPFSITMPVRPSSTLIVTLPTALFSSPVVAQSVRRCARGSRM